MTGMSVMASASGSTIRRQGAGRRTPRRAGLWLPRTGAGRLWFAEEFVELAIDFLEQRGVAGIPVLADDTTRRPGRGCSSRPRARRSFLFSRFRAPRGRRSAAPRSLRSTDTGSASSFALICAGDNSLASGPVLLFSSPGGRKGPRDFEEIGAFGEGDGADRGSSPSPRLSSGLSRPCLSLVVSIFTASKMKSDAGSSMSRISSLTETTGFMSPHSTGAGGAGGAAAGFEDEQADSSKQRPMNPAPGARRRFTIRLNTMAPRAR